MTAKKNLPVIPTTVYTDEITINEDGTITGWACALIDLGLLDASERQGCAAPRGECARGMTEAFQCEREKP